MMPCVPAHWGTSHLQVIIVCLSFSALWSKRDSPVTPVGAALTSWHRGLQGSFTCAVVGLLATCQGSVLFMFS